MAQQIDATTAKLAIKLGDLELAKVLVKAGFTNPRKIRDASDKALEGIKGVGKAKRGQIRAKFPRA